MNFSFGPVTLGHYLSLGGILFAISVVGSSKPLLLPDGDALDLTLTVDRRLAEGGFAGSVVDAQGEGVAGAHVSVGKKAVPFFKTGKEMRERLNKAAT